MSMVAPNMYVTPASPVVVAQIDRLNKNADILLERSELAVTDLQSLTFANVDLDPSFQYNDADLASMLDKLGPLPDIDVADWTAGLDLSAGNENFGFNPELLQRFRESMPDLLLPTVPQAGRAPDEPADPGDPVDPDAPARPALRDYDAPNIDFNVPVPEYSDYTAQVPFPTLREITLPTPNLPNIDNIVFGGVTPAFDGNPPDPADFQFVSQDYVWELGEKIKESALAQMDGKTGLPPAVEAALYERAREREMETGDRLVQQASEEWAAKGHRAPAGPLARRVDMARFDAAKKVSELAREQYIEGWRIQIEQYRNGLATALAYEQMSMQLFAQAEERRFQALRMKLDLTLSVYNALISKYNADAGVFQVQAQVYRDRIGAELAKVQVYAEQLRAAQLIGELNQQDVQIFAERLRSLQINAEIYAARVRGYEARFSAINSQVAVYRTQLESNQTLANIYESDVRAFSEMIRANNGREERFRTKGEIYSKKIDAWRTTYEGQLEGYKAEVEKARLTRDIYTSNTDRLQAWATAESGRIRALTDKYQAIAAEIGSRSEAERAKYALALSLAEASITRMKAAADILMKNGEINIQSGLTAANLMLRAKETASNTLAQLAAGMTSAANVNASISDSSGSSLSYNFSGEIEVY